ncbi:MAG: hypothetical protein Kow0032_07850 [Methyloligellaceae bacterium]
MGGITISDIVAVIALLLSGYAIWTTQKFNKRQLSLIESQEELNKRLLAQDESDALEARKADVGAKYVKLGSSKYKLRVFNKGKAVARNVRIEFPDGESSVPASELREKFPMEILEQHGSVDLIAAVSMDTPSKQTAVLRWEDDHSDSNEKTAYLTL